uniref:Uncharacterized protein n=1 Tax=Arundo donax TaxID=35708 RepID=A0A0A8Z3U3_ARUDO
MGSVQPFSADLPPFSRYLWWYSSAG